MAKSAISGIKDIAADGLNLIITTNDGKKVVIKFPKPADGKDGKDGFSPIVSLTPKSDNSGATLKIITDAKGNKVEYDILNGKDGKDAVSIKDITIDGNKHLIFTMDDNSIIDAGKVPGCDCDDLGLATKEDIDSLFGDLTGTPDDNLGLATKEDIDSLFGDELDDDNDLGLATKDDIDSLFGDNIDDDDDNLGLATKNDIDSLFNNIENSDSNLGLATEDDIDSLF